MPGIGGGRAWSSVGALLRRYADVLSRYAVFGGRAGRGEFWGYALVSLGLCACLATLDTLLCTYSPGCGVGWLGGAYIAAVAVPTTAAAVRRLHDLDSSGWWCLLMALPAAGPVALVLWLALPGDAAANRFGPRPGSPD